MKITKGYLKRLIKEQIAAMDDDDDYKVGDFLEILISDDGERSFEKVESPGNEYTTNYTRSYPTSFKALVKIEKIAKPEYSDD